MCLPLFCAIYARKWWWKVRASHKPNSVPAWPCDHAGGNHLSRTAVTHCLKQPTRRLIDEQPTSTLPEQAYFPSYLVLLQMGFTQPAGHPAAGELLPHHFTLARHIMPGGMFLWHFP
jgi:hypothetical protein